MCSFQCENSRKRKTLTRCVLEQLMELGGTQFLPLEGRHSSVDRDRQLVCDSPAQSESAVRQTQRDLFTERRRQSELRRSTAFPSRHSGRPPGWPRTVSVCSEPVGPRRAHRRRLIAAGARDDDSSRARSDDVARNTEINDVAAIRVDSTQRAGKTDNCDAPSRRRKDATGPASSR